MQSSMVNSYIAGDCRGPQCALGAPAITTEAGAFEFHWKAIGHRIGIMILMVCHVRDASPPIVLLYVLEQTIRLLQVVLDASICFLDS